MLKSRILDEAKADMADIRRFTKQQWGIEQSVLYLHEFSAKIELLAKMPALGVNRTDEIGYDIHSYFVGSHVIYYHFNEDEIIIRAILHQSMAPFPHLEKKY